MILLQVNLFGIIKIVGEFNGGGIHPFHRIEVLNFAFLSASPSLFKGSSTDKEVGL